MRVAIVKLKMKEGMLLSKLKMEIKKSRSTQMIQRYQHKSMRSSKKENLIMGLRKQQQMMILTNKISKPIKSQAYRLIITLKILILQMVKMKVKVKKSKPAIIKNKLMIPKIIKVVLIAKLNKIHKKQMDKRRQQEEKREKLEMKWGKIKLKMGNNKLQEILIIQKKEWNKMEKVILLKTQLKRLKNLWKKFNKRMIKKTTRL